MEIICTKKEKKELLRTLLSADDCPFAHCKGYKKCSECFSNRITWKTVNEEGKV